MFSLFSSIPFWIYPGARPATFLFKGTWADVSCFFAEGYGMMFPLFVAPVLAIAILAGEFVILTAKDVPKSTLLEHLHGDGSWRKSHYHSLICYPRV